MQKREFGPGIYKDTDLPETTHDRSGDLPDPHNSFGLAGKEWVRGIFRRKKNLEGCHKETARAIEKLGQAGVSATVYVSQEPGKCRHTVAMVPYTKVRKRRDWLGRAHEVVVDQGVLASAGQDTLREYASMEEALLAEYGKYEGASLTVYQVGDVEQFKAILDDHDML